MALVFDDLLSGSNIYFYDLGNPINSGSLPQVTSATALRYSENATLTGVNFGASVGQVTIGGLVQPIVSWSATSIVIGPIARGILRYGTQPLIVRDSAFLVGQTYNGTLLPPTGGGYVTLANPLATSGDRLTATPDLAAGDQIAWGQVLPTGTVEVFTDASFATTVGVATFGYEVNDGTGWGSAATQTVGVSTAFSGALTAATARLSGAFAPTIAGATEFAGTLVSGAAALAAQFSTFVSTQFSGALAAGQAYIRGTFTHVGQVIPELPPSTGGGSINPQSKVTIVNLALAKLGVPPIQSMGEASKAARVATSLFDIILDQELSRHFWKFSLYRVEIDEAVSDNIRGPFRYMYPLPSDWLTTVWIGEMPPGVLSYPEDVIPEWAHEGRFVLSNDAAPLHMLYVRRVQDSTQFHTLFIEALACRLAMEMCDSLTQSDSRWERVTIQYREALSEAKRVNAIMDPPRVVYGDSWLDARH